MVHPLKFLPRFGGMQKNFIMKKFLLKKKQFVNVKRKFLFSKQLLKLKIFILKTNGITNLRNCGSQVKKML